MKDEVKIYDKLDKNIIKKFTISTISTKTYYCILKNELLFYTILHYQQHKISTIFYYLYMSPILYKTLVFYITKILLNFIKLQKHY